MAEFHWIGSTGNSINKFYWNNINNWAVKTSSGIVRARTFGRLPQGNDTVKIGTDLHCFSPLLYGGYSGSTGVGASAGNWNQGYTAGDSHASTGYTAGVTGGGVCLIVASDILAASDTSSVSNAYGYGLINSTTLAGNPNGIWSGGNIASAAANNNLSTDALFFKMLATINPHAPGIANSSQAVSVPENSKYPFPYLGGGITGDIFNYLKNVWGVSYAGLNSINGVATSDSTVKTDNAWVGGGWTGGYSDLTPESQAGLRIRLGGQGAIGSRAAMIVSPGDGAVPQNRIFNIDLKTVADKIPGNAALITDITLNSRGNPLHSYAFRTGSFRSVISQGDAALLFEACTAGSIQTDYHNYTSIGPASRIGGMVVDSDNNDPRYHPWVVYFAGSITSGARNTTYASASPKTNFPWNNKLLINTNQLTYSTNYAKGMAGFTWSTVNPLIGIGEFGGTEGPIIYTAGASAVYYTTIPSVEIYSNTDAKPTSIQGGEQLANTAYNLEVMGNASLGAVLAHGTNVYYSSRGSMDATVYMGTLRMREGSVLDFTRNTDMDNWFIGGFTGVTSSIQIAGGILVEDDTCLIRPSFGCQFANTRIVGNDGLQGVDARGNAFFPNQNPQFNSAITYVSSLPNSNDALSLSAFPPIQIALD
jgi:hypothetical protein